MRRLKRIKVAVIEEAVEPVPVRIKPKTEEISLFSEPVQEITEQVEVEMERLLTPQLVNAQTIDPMIGMNQTTPYDFMK